MTERIVCRYCYNDACTEALEMDLQLCPRCLDEYMEARETDWAMELDSVPKRLPRRKQMQFTVVGIEKFDGGAKIKMEGKYPGRIYDSLIFLHVPWECAELYRINSVHDLLPRELVGICEANAINAGPMSDLPTLDKVQK